MEDILTQLKKDMMSPQNRKLAQPPEGLLILFLVMDRHSVFFLSLSRLLEKEPFGSPVVFQLNFLFIYPKKKKKKREDYPCRMHTISIHFLSPGTCFGSLARKLDCC